MPVLLLLVAENQNYFVPFYHLLTRGPVHQFVHRWGPSGVGPQLAPPASQLRLAPCHGLLHPLTCSTILPAGRSIGAEPSIRLPQHLGAGRQPHPTPLVTVGGTISQGLAPTAHTRLGLVQPAHLLHHPAMVLLSLGAIRAGKTSTAACCQHHVADAHHVPHR